MVDCADEERRDRCRAGDCTWHVGGRRPGWVASFLACIYVVVVLGYYPPKDRPYRAVGWVQVASHFFGRSVTLFCFFVGYLYTFVFFKTYLILFVFSYLLFISVLAVLSFQLSRFFARLLASLACTAPIYTYNAVVRFPLRPTPTCMCLCWRVFYAANRRTRAGDMCSLSPAAARPRRGPPRTPGVHRGRYAHGTRVSAGQAQRRLGRISERQ